MARRRLDQVLVERGLFASRARAAAAVLAGDVLIGVGRERAAKAGQPVAEDVVIEVASVLPYVSRGGVKLANALDELGLTVEGRRCLDVGASTGGFTDCLLQRGAAHVVALDVAYGELSWKLRSDERVTVIERCNARSLDPSALPYAPDLIVMDLSFISLTKVLGAVLGAAAARFDCLAMIKPQFEVGRSGIGKGGVVRDPALRRSALVAVGRAGLGLGAAVGGFASSGLPGPKGNRETFVWLREAGRGGVPDLEAAALAAEPDAPVEPGSVDAASGSLEASGSLDAVGVATGSVDAATVAAGPGDAAAVAPDTVDAATVAAGPGDAAAVAPDTVDARVGP